jgi:hypothetical protein
MVDNSRRFKSERRTHACLIGRHKDIAGLHMGLV